MFKGRIMRKFLLIGSVGILFLGCAYKEPKLATSIEELAGNEEVVGWQDSKSVSKPKVIIKKEVIYKDRVKTKVVYKEKVVPKIIYKEKIVPKLIYKSLPDSDNDGVADKFDKCPNTPKNLLVNHDGCPIITTLRFNFDFGKYEIKKIYYPQIKELAQILKSNPTLKIEIDGYTDNIGDEKYNLELSKKRAQAVKDLLVKYGINPNRIITKGFGEKYPLVPNDTYTNRALNRRVEIIDITNKH